MPPTLHPELPHASAVHPFKNDEVYHRIQQRRLQYVINPYHPRELRPIINPDDPHIAEYDQALDALAELLGGMRRAVLTGGLAIPATLLAQHPETAPRFYRQHYALHVGVTRSQFPELVHRANLNGNYYPFARIAMHPIKNAEGIKTSKRDVYYPLPWEEVQKLVQGVRIGRVFGMFCKSKNLRLIKIESGTGEIAPHECLTDYIDVYLHYYGKGRLCSNDDHSRRCPSYFTGATFRTLRGLQLPVANLAYLRLIKHERYEKNKKSPKGDTDRCDLERIASFLSPSNARSI